MSSKKNLALIKIYLLRNRIKIFLKLIRAKVKIEKKVRQSLLRPETVRTLETFIPVYIQNNSVKHLETVQELFVKCELILKV